jgi:hypothetical protein
MFWHHNIKGGWSEINLTNSIMEQHFPQIFAFANDWFGPHAEPKMGKLLFNFETNRADFEVERNIAGRKVVLRVNFELTRL